MFEWNYHNNYLIYRSTVTSHYIAIDKTYKFIIYNYNKCFNFMTFLTSYIFYTLSETFIIS